MPVLLLLATLLLLLGFLLLFPCAATFTLFSSFVCTACLLVSHTCPCASSSCIACILVFHACLCASSSCIICIPVSRVCHYTPCSPVHSLHSCSPYAFLMHTPRVHFPALCPNKLVCQPFDCSFRACTVAPGSSTGAPSSFLALVLTAPVPCVLTAPVPCGAHTVAPCSSTDAHKSSSTGAHCTSPPPR